MPSFDIIALDADDTLWHNELFYKRSEVKFAELMGDGYDPEVIEARLLETEGHNVPLYGYGIKSFMLSTIETAIRLSDGTIPAEKLQQIIELGRGMLQENVQLLPGVAEALPLLATRYHLMLLTKGDLLDQTYKLKRSGLEEYFADVEILNDKDVPTYKHLLWRYRLEPRRFLMVGNSLRSDILPVLELGSTAVYIPFELAWAHELAETPPADHPGFYELSSFADLPGFLQTLD